MQLVLSCKKELSCKGCKDGSKPPIANAGADQAISLPGDSATLDGSGSSDPEGNITTYQWTKISGPASSNIISASASKTTVKNLAAGIYQFELKVNDDGGLFQKIRCR